MPSLKWYGVNAMEMVPRGRVPANITAGIAQILVMCENDEEFNSENCASDGDSSD